LQNSAALTSAEAAAMVNHRDKVLLSDVSKAADSLELHYSRHVWLLLSRAFSVSSVAPLDGHLAAVA